MNSANLVRWSGIAAILAGLLGIAVSFFDENTPSVFAWVYIISNLLTILALIGIYLYQKDEAGLLGLIGFGVAMLGNLMLFIEGLYMVAGAVYAIGLIVLGIGALKAGKFPRWVPILWIVAPLIGSPGFFSESLTNLFFFLGAVVYGLGFIGAGYILWTRSKKADVLEAT